MVQRLEQGPPPPEHNFTTGYSTANTHAALREAFRVLAMPEQLAVLTNIVRTEAGVVAKQVTRFTRMGLTIQETSPRRQLTSRRQMYENCNATGWIAILVGICVLTQIGLLFVYRFCLLWHNHEGCSDSV